MKELKGFTRVHLARGEKKTIIMTLSRRELGMCDRDMQFAVAPGDFEIMVGASSDDIRLTGILTVK
ncbi:MAG: fibronectin type III-like domain-contianing protein [Bacillota bacterium]|nr:fibronectin type III-like domain-contianing protein [Bacillota bacterium]HPZ55095.1 fibronectin type III-like domain-contianing protein [Bacillota bacterium]HQD18266.1 fibronectin type III-like domain-contianing protein [Bacillota bacterium]